MSLLITSEATRCLTVERGLLTVPVEDALARCACPTPGCTGIKVDALPLHARILQRHFLAMGTRFVERLRVRGYEPASSSLWLHGPYPSLMLDTIAIDMASPTWNEAKRVDDRWATPAYPGSEHPEYVLPFVHEIHNTGYVDYRFYGYFLHPEIVTQTRNLASGDDRTPFIYGERSWKTHGT